MGWIRFVGSLNSYVSVAKEPYKRDCFLQKRHLILRSLQTSNFKEPTDRSHPIAHLSNMNIVWCMLQCVTVCCSVLQCSTVWHHLRRRSVVFTRVQTSPTSSRTATVCCNVLWYATLCCSVSQCSFFADFFTHFCSVLQYVAVWYSVLQCVAEWLIRILLKVVLSFTYLFVRGSDRAKFVTYCHWDWWRSHRQSHRSCFVVYYT